MDLASFCRCFLILDNKIHTRLNNFLTIARKSKIGHDCREINPRTA